MGFWVGKVIIWGVCHGEGKGFRILRDKKGLIMGSKRNKKESVTVPGL